MRRIRKCAVLGRVTFNKIIPFLNIDQMCDVLVSASVALAPTKFGILKRLSDFYEIVTPTLDHEVWGATMGLKINSDSVAAILRGTYGVSDSVLCTTSTTCKYAILAGLRALADSNLITQESNWKLPECYKDRVGIVYSTSFGQYDQIIQSLDLQIKADTVRDTVDRVCNLLDASDVPTSLGDEIRAHFAPNARSKLALQMLLTANVQLAQLVGAKGPNTLTSNSCASTVFGLHIAHNFLKCGDADIIVVIGSDLPISNQTGITKSFGDLKVASRRSTAMTPFSKDNDGFIFGEAALCIVLESPRSSRQCQKVARVLNVQTANSAYHGTRLDALHITNVLRMCILKVCASEGVDLKTFAERCVYVSHETCTQLCGAVEVAALRGVFSDHLSSVIVANSKQFTGHTMGACLEDVFAIMCLSEQKVPTGNVSDILPEYSDLNLGVDHQKKDIEYVVHASFGIGSHVSVIIYGRPHMS